MYLWGIWSLVSPQLWALRWAHQMTGGWGRAIGMVSVLNFALIEALVFVSDPRKKLRAIEPEIAFIKKNHAADRQKRDILLLELYRREGIEGFALWVKPLMALVTIWLLLAMYVALWKIPELRGASFFWIPDLSARDPLYLLPVGSVLLSVLGWLAAPNTLPPSESRTRGLVPTVLFACVVFLFPASFVLWGFASKVIVLSGNLGKRILMLFRT